MAALLPISEVVQCVASSSFRVVQGLPTEEIAARLHTTLSPCFDDEQLKSRLAPLITVLADADTGEILSEIEPSTLAWALYATIQNLSDMPVDNDLFADLLGTVRSKFENTILKGSQPPPILSGVFAVRSTRTDGSVSPEIIEQQMVETLKVTVLGALHDANNFLSVLTAGISEAKSESENLTAIVAANVHLLPADVALLVPQYSGAIAKNVGEIDSLLHQTINLIRRVQSLLSHSNPSNTDLLEIPRLFEEGGFMWHIRQKLENIQRDLTHSNQGLEGLFRLSGTHGHFLPKNVFDEGMRLLCAHRECFGDFQELVTLISGLLDLLKDVVEGIKKEPGPILLNDQFTLLKPRMMGAVMSKGVQVRLDLEPEPWTIWGLTIHISQILLNLACNARDAMERSGRLSVSTRNVALGHAEVAELQAEFIRPQPIPGDYLRIRIEDMGPGIPLSILPRIFDLAFSGKGSTGIGLAVVLQLIRNMGGFLAVETSTEAAEDRQLGTTFSIYFPRSH